MEGSWRDGRTERGGRGGVGGRGGGAGGGRRQRGPLAVASQTNLITPPTAGEGRNVETNSFQRAGGKREDPPEPLLTLHTTLKWVRFSCSPRLVHPLSPPPSPPFLPSSPLPSPARTPPEEVWKVWHSDLNSASCISAGLTY